MILYKYVSWEAGKKILQGSCLGFSQTMHFNDVFEGPVYPEVKTPIVGDNVFGQLRQMAKQSAWAENTGVLSLTRTPINPLMWAHYADQHRGMVIGVNLIEAGLTDETTNLIPAQYGSVIYVSARPAQDFVARPKTSIAVGATHYFPADHFEKLQRLFLHKPICWAYEEEVRVVKCLRPKEGEMSRPDGLSIIRASSRDLYIYPFSPTAICEVYYGFRAGDEADEMHSTLLKTLPHVRQFCCELDSQKFGIKAAPFVTIRDLSD